MRHTVSIATVGRTVVVGGYLVAVVLVGRPVWLALVIGVLLAGVWVAPFVLDPPRRPGSIGVRVVHRSRPGPG